MTDTILIITASADEDAHRYLAKLAGMTQEEYERRTERWSLLPSDPGESWPAAEARQLAQVLWPSLIGRRTIMLGSRIGAAFSITWPPTRWASLDSVGTQVALVPRPSIRDPWWEDAANRAAVRRFLGSTFGTDS